MGKTVCLRLWLCLFVLPVMASGAEPGGAPKPPPLPRYAFAVKCFRDDGQWVYSGVSLMLNARNEADALDQLPLQVAKYKQARSKGPNFQNFSTYKITRMQMQPVIGTKWIELGDQALKDELREVPELPVEQSK